MAFELLFFKHRKDKISLQDIITYFTKNKNFIIKPLDTDLYYFVYRNKDTKVYFSMSYNEGNELDTTKPFPEEYEFCYFNLVINYLRPSFYAREIMPIIEDFCIKFNLFIYDLQDNSEEIIIKQPSVEELISSYNLNNKKACIEFNKQYPVNTVSQTKTDYFFNYSFNKSKIEAEVSIPEIFFVKNNQTNEISTCFIWSGEETIFPKTDYVYIIKKVKGFLGIKKQVDSILNYDDVYDKVKPYLEEFENNLYIINNINEELTQIYHNLPISDDSDFDLIEIDEIVDIDLQSNNEI